MDSLNPEVLVEKFRRKDILKLLIISFLSFSLYFFLPKYSIIFLLIAATLVVAIVTKRYEVNKIGVETATFTTVIAGAAVNPELGAAIGFLTILLQVMTGSGGSYVLWVVPGYVAAGALAAVIGPENIVMKGIMISAGLQGFFGVATALLSPEYLIKFIPRGIANIVFNILIFRMMAEPVLGVLI